MCLLVVEQDITRREQERLVKRHNFDPTPQIVNFICILQSWMLLKLQMFIDSCSCVVLKITHANYSMIANDSADRQCDTT